QRDDFIAAAAAHATTLLGETPDWRTIERWLRDTEQKWRERDLGSFEPGAWKKFDLRLKAALAPVRDALLETRNRAKAGRRALIDEAKALADNAIDRDTPSQTKAMPARCEEQGKA